MTIIERVKECINNLYKETPLQQFKGNFAKVLKTYVQIAECYNDQHKENHVHFALSCENPFFNYWNFAI